MTNPETSSDLVKPVAWATEEALRKLKAGSPAAVGPLYSPKFGEEFPLYDTTTIERLTAERDEWKAQVLIQNHNVAHNLARAEAAESLAARQAEALKAAAGELQRLRSLFLPTYDGKVGEPSLAILELVRSATESSNG